MTYSHPVTVIGGANVDIQGKSQGQLVMEDSNPGFIQTSLGGVGRNIADNIRRLRLDTRLITAMGNDKEGEVIKNSAIDLGIDIRLSIITTSHRTSTYLYVLDEQGELVVAVSDMDIIERLTPDYFSKLIPKIDHSPYTVIDANLPQKTIEYLANNLVKTHLVLDPVSITKAIKAAAVLGKFYAIKVNKTEAEALTGLTLNSSDKIIEAGHQLVAAGVDRVFITLGEGGVYYQDSDDGFFREAIKTEVINTTGAGDAFTAAMVYGFVEGLNKQSLVDFCIAASTIALCDQHTIAADLSIEAVKTILSKNL